MQYGFLATTCRYLLICMSTVSTPHLRCCIPLLLVFRAPGARVIIACRDMERAQVAVKDIIESSGSQNVVCMKLDLADSKSIREFAEAINKG